MKYQQDIKYLDNYPEILYKLYALDLPKELNVIPEGIEIKKGDEITFIDKKTGIGGFYKITNVKKDGTAKLKFIKIDK